MSCSFYFWDHGYACRVTGKNVDEDIYHRFCRDYDYKDCPIYKQGTGSSSSSCYLTSACVNAYNLPDDCHELQTLRHFRDTYMREDAERSADVCHYYHTAPKIVEAINARDDAKTIFTGMYNNLVLPCVRMIEQGDLKGAYKLYRNTALTLEKTYL